MVRLAVATSPAVILVGPPGTGKTTLLRELVDEIRAEPTTLGFSEPVLAPKWVTPDESWSTADLVGGDTVDANGVLRFRPGRVLEAIASNRWLVLDEVNRADMDKIFGALLTWLSGQSVELGPVAKNVDAPTVTLAWSDTAGCDVEGVDALAEETPVGDAVRYAAGTEWRLLATYNAVDAQRVFRMGQAIGRRFLRVPIPPPTVEQFEAVLSAEASDLPKPLRDRIVSLYHSHLDTPETELGPAMFLRMPDYLRSGTSGDPGSDGYLVAGGTDLGSGVPVAEATGPDGGETALPQLALGSFPADPAGELPQSAEEVEAVPPAGSAASDDLLAEAYVVNVGAFIARYEGDELAALRQRIVEREGALSVADWEWVLDQVRYLA